ncbi:MAG: hypothetical protein V3V08_22320 [Nannocystaceae bacterium]
MIVVTGTMRSGTSMWMQILVAGGFSPIGERYPESWQNLCNAANPDGFYESELVGGIYYRTNPHPVSGAYLAPEPTRPHVVKVFIPGLIRTDVVFVDRCVATVRSWRAYVVSVRRLQTLTRGASSPVETAETMSADGSGEEAPAALRWWAENFALIRDLATRGYPAHVVSYDALLRDPEKAVGETFEWIGAGDMRAAARVVDRRPLRRAPPDLVAVQRESRGLDSAHLEVFDEFYDHVDRGLPLSQAFVDRLNATDEALRPQVLEYHARAKIEATQHWLDRGGS